MPISPALDAVGRLLGLKMGRLQCGPVFRGESAASPMNTGIKATKYIASNGLCGPLSQGVRHQFEIRVFGKRLDGKAQTFHELEHAGVVGQHQTVDFS